MNPNENIRYSGHTALCEIDIAGQQAIANASVLIVGAGGLGSAVAIYLAAAGVGHITIVDPDIVRLSNLQRQIIHSSADQGRPKAISAAESMTAINPHISVTPKVEALSEANGQELVGSHTIVVDCTDNFATRILVDKLCRELDKPYVFGAVSRFSGQLFTHTPGTAGYTDFFGSEPSSADVPCSVNGVLNTLVGTVGTLQATETLKYIVGTGDLLTNRLLVFDLLTMQFATLPLL